VGRPASLPRRRRHADRLGGQRRSQRRLRLRRLGVGRGDRVAAIVPNVPEAIIGLLATASLGAIWSSCAPEFGTRSIVDRLSQIEPTVLLAVDGYRFGGRDFDRRDVIEEVRDALPGLARTVLIQDLDPSAVLSGDDWIRWDDFLAGPTEPLEDTPNRLDLKIRATDLPRGTGSNLLSLQ
jgi:acetoacetyl-CoA synthetase